jgi:glycosyltransferase involved in cell wall biosynthesis
MNKLTSVITSTFNKSKYLELTLAGYAMQADPSYELVIVNDGGTDDTESIIERYASKLNIKYIYQENSGIAAARNKALQAASGDNIIIVDDDRIPVPNFVQEHKRRLGAKTKLVSIGRQFKVLSFYSNLIQLDYFEWMELFDRHPELTRTDELIRLITVEQLLDNPQKVLEFNKVGNYDPAGLLPIVQTYGEDLDGFYFGWAKAFGGNIAFDRSCSRSDIKYDSRYDGYGKEDTDLAYQLLLDGYRFVFTQHAANYHQEHPRGRKEYQQHFINFHRFCQKYESLEVYLHQLDNEGKISQAEANSFLHILDAYREAIVPRINRHVERKQVSLS